MISHTTLGTNNLEKAAAFYDALLADLGGKRHLETERAVIWRLGESPTMLGVSIPFNGEPATIGNGSMVAFAVDSPAQVDALHEKALALGGSNEGDPGERLEGVYYGAYFRDPDGNKISLFHLYQAPQN